MKTKIEWTEYSWNPVTGCTKISQGCSNCYAERMALRLQAIGNPRYAQGFQVTLHPELVDYPLQWRTPRIVFVNSMSDLFHQSVPLNFIKRVFQVMNRCPQHTFQILTKRSGRLRRLSGTLDWTPNIWMGVTVESKECISRIDDLARTNARVKFLSCEPLLGPMPNLDLTHIDWVIVGGESGPGARIVKKEWAIDLLRLCKKNDIPYFFKQWGGVNKKQAGRLLQGRTWDERPPLAHETQQMTFL